MGELAQFGYKSWFLKIYFFISEYRLVKTFHVTNDTTTDITSLNYPGYTMPMAFFKWILTASGSGYFLLRFRDVGISFGNTLMIGYGHELIAETKLCEFANRDIKLNQSEILVDADEIWLSLRFIVRLDVNIQGLGTLNEITQMSTDTGIAGLRRIWIQVARVNEGIKNCVNAKC